MSQNTAEQRPARPLPGLVKFYLAQLYPLVVTLLLARQVLSIVGMEAEAVEPTLWSLATLGAGFSGVALLVGLHTRAAWVPRFAGNYNLALIALYLLLTARLLVAMADLRFGRWRFEPADLYLFLLPAFMLMQTPVLYAWRRYFTASPKVAAAFGSTPDDERRLPGLGVAFLQVISAAYFTFFASFLGLVAWRASGEFSQGMWGVVLTTALPFVIMPAVIYYLARLPGRPARPLYIALSVFGVVICLWTRVPYLVINLAVDSYNELSMLLSVPVTMPISLLPLLLCIGVLGWKIWADKDEQRWFADGHAASRTPSMFSIYALGLLFYNIGFLFNIVQAIILSPRYAALAAFWSDWIIAILSLGLAALCVLLLSQRARQGLGEKRLALLTFGGALLLSLAGCGLMLLDIAASNDKADLLSTLLRMFRVFGAPVALAIFALLHWRARYRTGVGEAGAERTGGFFGLPTPYLAFALLCALVMSGSLPEKALQLLGSLLADENDLYWLRNTAGPVYTLLNLEYWAAYLVFPVLAFKSFKKLAAGQQARFFPLGLFWILAIAFTLFSEIAGLMQNSFFSYGLRSAVLIHPLFQTYAYGVVIFMLYLAARDKNAAPGGAS